MEGGSLGPPTTPTTRVISRACGLKKYKGCLTWLPDVPSPGNPQPYCSTDRLPDSRQGSVRVEALALLENCQLGHEGHGYRINGVCVVAVPGQVVPRNTSS